MKNLFNRLSANTRLVFQNEQPKNVPTAPDSNLIEKIGETAKKTLEEAKAAGKGIYEYLVKAYEKAGHISNDTWEKMKTAYVDTKEGTEKVTEETWNKIKKFYEETIEPFFNNVGEKSTEVVKDLEKFFTKNGKKLSEESKEAFDKLLNETKELKEKAKDAAEDVKKWGEKSKDSVVDAAEDAKDWTKEAQKDVSGTAKEKYQAAVKTLNELGDKIKDKEEQLVGKMVMTFSKKTETPETPAF